MQDARGAGGSQVEARPAGKTRWTRPPLHERHGENDTRRTGPSAASWLLTGKETGAAKHETGQARACRSASRNRAGVAPDKDAAGGCGGKEGGETSQVGGKLGERAQVHVVDPRLREHLLALILAYKHLPTAACRYSLSQKFSISL